MFTRENSPYLLLIGLLLFLCGYGCTKNEQDQTPPTVQILSPFENKQLFIGDTLQVNVMLFDDALNNLIIRVRDDEYDYPPDAPSNLFTWDTTIENRLFGWEAELTIDIPIPDNLEALPGILLLKAYDDEGNQTEWETRRFNILPEFDIIPPEITLLTESVVTTTGSIFGVIADVTDNQSLDMVRIEMTLEGSDEIQFKLDYEETDFSNNYFHIEEFIDAPTEPGQYELTIFAFDEVGNSDEKTISVKIE